MAEPSGGPCCEFLYVNIVLYKRYYNLNRSYKQSFERRKIIKEANNSFGERMLHSVWI